MSLLGLSIDYTSDKLYWISGGNATINRCSLDGSGLEVLETMKKELVKATALAVMGEWREFRAWAYYPETICAYSLS